MIYYLLTWNFYILVGDLVMDIQLNAQDGDDVHWEW